MKRKESRWRRRRRGYRYLLSSIAVLGGSFILAGLWPRDWAWAFAVVGFVGFVLLMKHALVLWDVDRLVFEQAAASVKPISTPKQFPIEPDEYRLPRSMSPV